jgi:hypothetical protein
VAGEALPLASAHYLIQPTYAYATYAHVYARRGLFALTSGRHFFSQPTTFRLICDKQMTKQSALLIPHLRRVRRTSNRGFTTETHFPTIFLSALRPALVLPLSTSRCIGRYIVRWLVKKYQISINASCYEAFKPITSLAVIFVKNDHQDST